MSKVGINELKQRAKQGDMIATFLCGRAYASGALGIARHYKKGFDFYEDGTVTNNALCIYGLATCYEQGLYRGCKQTAKELFIKAFPQIEKDAQGGCKYSQYAYANYFWFPLGAVEKDLEKAVE